MKEFESRQIVNSQGLSHAETQDIVLFSGTPAYSAILKLMEGMLDEASAAAVKVPIHEREKRMALLDQASAMAELFAGLKEKITYLVADHLGMMQKREVELAMQDQQNIEDIIASEINQGR